MKKFIRTALLSLALLSLLVQSGCYGSFELTRRLYDWNGTIEDKNVRSLVLFALGVVQIYTIAAVIDAAVLNLIEFWNGSNPISMAEGAHEEQLVTYQGKSYRLEARRNRFSITELNENLKNQPVDFVFTPENLTWNLQKGNQLIALSRLEKQADGEIAVRVLNNVAGDKLINAHSGISFAAFNDALYRTSLSTASR